MSDPLQPGQHPDADQLNAFVENALPLHERQRALDHLAICADCREVVYLSQHSDLGEFPAPQATATHKPWFSGLKLAWPAAAVVACGVIFAIRLHNIGISNSKTVITTTTAIQKTPPTLPAAPHLPQPDQSKPAPARAPNNHRPIAAPSATTLGTVTEASAGSIKGTSEQQSVMAFSFQDHNTTSRPQTSPVPTTGLIHGSAYRSIYEAGGAVTTAITSPIRGPVLKASPANADAVNHPHQKDASTATLQNNQIDFSAKHSFDRQYPAAPLLSASSIAATGTSQTVTVNGAMTTVDVIPSEQFPLENKLPSNLPVLSIVSSAGQTLAIDTNGALFLSKDRGISWQSVPAQWKGRAQNLRLAPPSQAVESSLAPHTGPTIMGGSIAQTQLSVIELTNDTGVVWTSTDGQTWKQK